MSQKKQLKEIEDKNTRANGPVFAINISSENYAACSKLNPEYEDLYAKMLQTHKLTKYDEHDKLRKGVVEELFKLDFIDTSTLGNHLSFQSTLQQQLFQQMSKSVAQGFLKKKDTTQCDELAKNLSENYSTAYASIENRFKVRTKVTGAPKDRPSSCSMGFPHITDDKHRMSTKLILMDFMGSGISLEYSTKIYSPEKKALPVEMTWLDFGGINSRFRSHMERPGGRILIGTMVLADIVPILQHLKERKNMIAASKSTVWKKSVAYEFQNISVDEVNKFAQCTAKMAPQFKSALIKAGFKL